MTDAVKSAAAPSTKPTARIIEGLCWALLLAAGIGVYFGGSIYVIGIAFGLCSSIALTQSWALFSALTGYISLGSVVFYGIGAYITVLMVGSFPLAVILAVAALSAGLFAAVVGWPVLRVRGPYFVILTFGLAELVKNLVMQNEARLGQFSRMLFVVPPLETLYLLMLGCAIVATIVAVLVRRSRFGAGLLAIRENEEAAETIGVPVTRLKIVAFTLSAIIPGAVGGLAALRTSYFEPSTVFDPSLSLAVLTMVLVGGGDDARGPVIGSLLFMLLSELLWARLPQLYLIVLGVTLIVFVLFIPRGVTSLLPATGRRR